LTCWEGLAASWAGLEHSKGAEAMVASRPRKKKIKSKMALGVSTKEYRRFVLYDGSGFSNAFDAEVTYSKKGNIYDSGFSPVNDGTGGRRDDQIIVWVRLKAWRGFYGDTDNITVTITDSNDQTIDTANTDTVVSDETYP
jgi:hypothetical protein